MAAPPMAPPGLASAASSLNQLFFFEQPLASTPTHRRWGDLLSGVSVLFPRRLCTSARSKRNCFLLARERLVPDELSCLQKRVDCLIV